MSAESASAFTPIIISLSSSPLIYDVSQKWSPLEPRALVLDLGTNTSAGVDFITTPLSLIPIECCIVCAMLATMFKGTAGVGSLTRGIF